MLNKNVTPNLIALAIIAFSFVLQDPLKGIVLNIGLFALSGALTNWLAIHMLFERVPGLYGSGVIPLHFEEFKHGILTLVTKHLFNKQVVESTIGSGNESNAAMSTEMDIGPFIDGLNLDLAYDQLKGTIMESVSYTHLTLPTTPYV